MAYLGSKHFNNKKERDKHLVDFVVQSVTSFESQTQPDRARWLENEELFAGKMDWGAEREKEDWMSRPFLHEFSPIIRRAAVATHNMLMNQPSFFELEPGSNGDPYFVKIIDKLVKHEVDRIQFAKKFAEYLLTGGIYGFAVWKHVVSPEAVWKNEVILDRVDEEMQATTKGAASNVATGAGFILPDGREEVDMNIEQALDVILGPSVDGKYSQPKLKETKILKYLPNLKLVNPFNFFWLPDVDDVNESPIIIERCYKKFFELHSLFETGVLDRSMKERMMKSKVGKGSSYMSSTGSYEVQKIKQRDQFSDKSTYYPTIELLEYYGPILTKDGDIIEENAHVIVGNSEVVLKAGRNEYFRQKPPYFSATFSKKPFKAVGAGIADGASEQQKLINHLFGGFLDLLNMDIYNPTVVNVDRLADPNSILGGIKPLQVIEATGDSKASDIASHMPTNSNIAPQLFQAIESLRLSGQKGSGVNTMTANPASRARISAKEVMSNESQANESIAMLAFELDENCIKPLIERTYGHILQFGFERNALDAYETEGVIGNDEYQYLLGFSREDRLKELSKKIRLNIKGFRDKMEKEQLMMRYNELLLTISQNPEAIRKVDWDQVLRDGVELYNFDPDKWLIQNTPYDKAQEENNLLLVGHLISVLPDDDDNIHLGIHYEAFAQSPNDNFAQHIAMHIMGAQQKGMQPVMPPPEIAQMLGLDIDQDAMAFQNRMTQ